MLVYREYQPHVMLDRYVETYWTVQGFLDEGEYHRVLPDGCVDIIFSFTANNHPSGLLPFVPNVVGTMTCYSQGYYPSDVDFLGIRFKPAGITAFIRSPINEFTDRRIDLALVDGSLFDDYFHMDLPGKTSVGEKIEHIDAYFIRKLKYVFGLEPQIVHAVDLIKRTKGLLSPTDIASKVCLSPRHFERKFKSAVGISPKTFSKVTKFGHSISYLKKHPGESLFSVAVDCGYYDHAHMIREFQFMSGSSPSYFKL
ncbi:MAG: helix-turn-helix transcriptional regulator [Breznakibacter sp.]